MIEPEIAIYTNGWLAVDMRGRSTCGPKSHDNPVYCIKHKIEEAKRLGWSARWRFAFC